jgi:surface polysaccharide O-acyltransferase-like enzyme
MTLSSERRYDLDWLRVLAVLLLIPFHVALIFVLDPNAITYVKDVVNSRVLDEAAGFVHMWHMPMLFIISGSATYFALGFRSAGQYIRKRFLRLFVPLVFGVLTFVPFTTYIRHSNILSLQEGYTRFFRLNLEHLDGMNGTFTPAHLWFILYLFVFSLVGLPLFLTLRVEQGKGVIQVLRTWMTAPLSLIAWGIPLTLAAATNILGGFNPLYYFLVFFYGFVLASDARFQQSIDKLTSVTLAYGVFAAMINVMMPIESYAEWSPQWMALGLMYQMGRWTLTLAVLGLGHRFLNRTNNVLRCASEAEMPFYLLHTTFSVMTGNFAIQLDAPVAVKYPLIVLVATGLTLVAYELVRRWNVTRWLFGMRPIKKGMRVASNVQLDGHSL